MTITTMWVTILAATALLTAGGFPGGAFPGGAFPGGGFPGGGGGGVAVPGGGAGALRDAVTGADSLTGAGTRAGALTGAGAGTPTGTGTGTGTGHGAGGIGCAGPPGPRARCWPVTGPETRGRPVVLRAFDPPPTPWSAGHRGVDLLAAPATPVRAAAPGEITFTGQVAGTPVLVLRHPGGLRTTYQPVHADLPLGAHVPAGARLGTVTGTPLPHCPVRCLHWGLLDHDDTYLDPLSLLPPSLRQPGRSRLLPVNGSGRWPPR